MAGVSVEHVTVNAATSVRCSAYGSGNQGMRGAIVDCDERSG